MCCNVPIVYVAGFGTCIFKISNFQAVVSQQYLVRDEIYTVHASEVQYKYLQIRESHTRSLQFSLFL